MQWQTQTLSFLTAGRWRGDGWWGDGCLSHSPTSGVRTALAWQEARSLKEWFSWGLWSGSAFPRETTAANLGTVNEVVLKADYMAETWLQRPVRPVLVEILNMEKWLYSSEVFCVVNPQNLLKSVGDIFSRILGHIALTFSNLQHANNKVLCGILPCKRGDDRSQLLFCF